LWADDHALVIRVVDTGQGIIPDPRRASPGLGIGLQLSEQLLLIFDRSSLTSQFVLLDAELSLCGLELVDRAASGIGDDAGEDVGLDLILRRLQARQQRDSRGAAGGEPRNCQRLDVTAELVDSLPEGLGSTFHPNGFVLEHFEIRLRLEVRVGGGVGTIAGSLDLPGRLPGRVVAGLRRGIRWHDGGERDDGRHGDQQRCERAPQIPMTLVAALPQGATTALARARRSVGRGGDGRDGSGHCRSVTGKVWPVTSVFVSERSQLDRWRKK
jgi:hypothetical protein